MRHTTPTLFVIFVSLVLLLVACGANNEGEESSSWNVSENDNTESPDACPNSAEGYDYFSTDAEACDTADIACPDDDQQPFQHPECGCGCRLSNAETESEPDGETESEPDENNESSSNDCLLDEEDYNFSPEECEDIDFGCPPGTVRFDDDCGCGCEGTPFPELDECPTEDDGYDYYYGFPDQCVSDFTCGNGEEFFANECGCGCVEVSSQDPEPIPEQCPDEEDGYDYISHDPEECELIFISCDEGQEGFDAEECGCGCVDIEPESEDQCTAKDAEGVGDPCPGEPIYVFDGTQCVNIVAEHCHCEGPGCTDFNTKAECEEEYAECLSGGCPIMDAAGDGEMCDGFYGYSYQGGDTAEEACVGMFGCECIGEDCDDAFFDFEECAAYHQQCTD